MDKKCSICVGWSNVFHSVPLSPVLGLGDKPRSLGRFDIQSNRFFLATTECGKAIE